MCSVLLSAVGDLLFTTLQVVVCGGIMLFLILALLGMFKLERDYWKWIDENREAEKRHRERGEIDTIEFRFEYSKDDEDSDKENPEKSLIISGAGRLDEKSVNIISDYVNQDEQKVAIVLEDSESDLHGLWKKYPKLRSRFLNVINISKYDESELVKLAESYAKRRGYEISEEVRMVTLREIFEKRMITGEDVNYEDVMAVIDEAVVNLEKRNMKNLFMTVLDNAYKEASMFTLLPEDFD